MMRENAKRGWDDREVTVDKEELLVALKENREKHIANYRVAMESYTVLAKAKLEKLKDKAQKILDENFADISKRIEEFDPEEGQMQDVIQLISSMTFDLRVPEDHSKAYDVAIEMATWEKRDEIILLQSQFECFVRDDWDWSKDFEHLNFRYSKAVGAMG